VPRAACEAEADPGLTENTVPHYASKTNSELDTGGGIMSSDLPEWFIRAFAMPRLSPYLTTAETSGIEADGLYLWNLQSRRPSTPRSTA
jgi:hypothetical protein